MARSKSPAIARSQLRIIGGQWRGRKLWFNAAPGLRPTPDRVRETLFNWLAAEINGAQCLDLFAGSGALGLEALSRGAQHCTFIDSSPAVIGAISEQLVTLGATDVATCTICSAQKYLGKAEQAFNIVFLDPPFAQDLIAPAVQALLQHELLAEDALVYVETHAAESAPVVPDKWQLHREKQAGDVVYRLFRCTQ